MSQDHPRKHPRYRVNLEVRFANAKDFLVEYAENLSRSGLFVKGGQHLQERDIVTVDLVLSGYSTYRVEAEVAHVLDGDTAERFGRTAGAGLHIVSAPPGFDEALSDFLGRLGRRADAMVLSVEEEVGLLFAAAGYQNRTIHSPDDLAAAVARSPIPVVALLAPRNLVKEYSDAALRAGAGNIVIAVDSGRDDFDAILSALDEEL